ncbi:hypothetical protein GYMLUDRAFT_703807 [Collybiopsis luxurians FD-317 M1]|uniref:DUF4604 domain-containing protein n=1 Tax=Collybiopsis luxurians FD-317 M1 TaxID=944289 RepID=A0A0D0CR38_9AGAR|nr:hypothetical protein GYMLUDRAFT_703807 [Collybiopsis luxurians FD-317 M1]
MSSSRRAKSPTRAQLSSRLAYEQKVPKFLQRLQNQVDGRVADEDEPTYDDSGYGEDYRNEGRGRGGYGNYQEDGNGYDDGDFEYINDGSGRPPIPLRPRSPQSERPPIPTRPDDDPGSADEDSDDEKPQVVVLKAGKHLSEREAENERRKGGLMIFRAFVRARSTFPFTTYVLVFLFCGHQRNWPANFMNVRKGTSATTRP